MFYTFFNKEHNDRNHNDEKMNEELLLRMKVCDKIIFKSLYVLLCGLKLKISLFSYN